MMSLDSTHALISYPIALSMELKNFHLICQLSENGAKLRSHSELAVAADPDGCSWYLKVSPNGDSVDDKGRVSAYLHCSGGDEKHRRYAPGIWTVTGSDGTVVKTVSAVGDFNCQGEKIPLVYVGPSRWGYPKLCSHDDLKQSGCVDFVVRFTGTVHVIQNGDCDTTAKCVTNVPPSSGS